MLVSVALVGAIALCLHLWAWLEPACANESRRIIMKASGSVGCFEFWLNRYQGLIGNLLTAAVAGVTLIWVAKALVPASRQASAIAAQTLKTLAGELASQSERVDGIRRPLTACNLPLPRANPVVWGNVNAMATTAQSETRMVAAAIARFREVQIENGTPPMLLMARKMTAGLEKLKLAATDIHVLYDASGGRDHEPVAEEYAAELASATSAYEHAIDAVVVAFDEAYQHLCDEIALAWREVRELEAQAIGSWWTKRNIRTLLPDRS